MSLYRSPDDAAHLVEDRGFARQRIGRVAAPHGVDPPFGRSFALHHEGQEVRTLHLFGNRQPGGRQTGRGDVHVGDHGVRHGRGDAPGPADQERHPDSVFIERAFGHELRSAVVAHEDDDRVVAQAVVRRGSAAPPRNRSPSGVSRRNRPPGIRGPAACRDRTAGGSATGGRAPSGRRKACGDRE